jgi:hypothetical protein
MKQQLWNEVYHFMHVMDENEAQQSMIFIAGTVPNTGFCIDRMNN